LITILTEDRKELPMSIRGYVLSRKKTRKPQKFR